MAACPMTGRARHDSMQAQRGVLISCDVPMRQFIMWLDKDARKFILHADLDDGHLFVKPEAVSFIKEEIEKFVEKQVYAPEEELQAAPRR